MRPTIATTAGAAWETDLARTARDTGLARVLRCTDPAMVRAVVDRIDALVVDAETSWIHDIDVAAVGRDIVVIGIASDEPGARRLRALGIEELVPPGTRPNALISLIAASIPATDGVVVRVTGPRGAPGRSEVALALAAAWSGQAPTALVELDHDAPSLGLRTGIPPGADRTHPPTGPSLIPSPLSGAMRRLTEIVVASAVATHRVTVLDVGPWRPSSVTSGTAVLVAEATPIGLVRLARLCAEWDGPTPTLVMNRWDDQCDLAMVRSATGLEPAVVIPRLAARRTTEPMHEMVRALVPLTLPSRARGLRRRTA